MHAWKVLQAIPPVVTTIEKEYTESGLELTFTGTSETLLTGHLHQGENPENYETERCRGIIKKEPDEPRLPEIWEEVEAEPSGPKTVDNISSTGNSRGWKEVNKYGYTTWPDLCAQAWAALPITGWSGGLYKNSSVLVVHTYNYHARKQVKINAEKNNLTVHFSDWYDVYPTTHPKTMTINFQNIYPTKDGHVIIGEEGDTSNDCSTQYFQIEIDVKEAWEGEPDVDMNILPDQFTPFCCSDTNQTRGFDIRPYDPGSGWISLHAPGDEPVRKWTIPLGLVTPANEIKSYIDFTLADGTKIPPAPLRISAIPTKNT